VSSDVVLQECNRDVVAAAAKLAVCKVCGVDVMLLLINAPFNMVLRAGWVADRHGCGDSLA
jgi:hypothetical protein